MAGRALIKEVLKKIFCRLLHGKELRRAAESSKKTTFKSKSRRRIGQNPISSKLLYFHHIHIPASYQPGLDFGSISYFFSKIIWTHGGWGLEKALCSKLKSINAFYHCK